MYVPVITVCEIWAYIHTYVYVRMYIHRLTENTPYMHSMNAMQDILPMYMHSMNAMMIAQSVNVWRSSA